MRSLLLLVVLFAASHIPAPASAGHLCTGTVSVTSYAPVSLSTGPTLNIRVVFTGDGPGYIPGECDIGWITTCRLIVNNQDVSESCAHINGDDRCHESGTPYVCEMEMTASLATFTGTHNIQATLGMTWGCCGWIGGAEATDTASWSVYHVKTL